MPTAIVYIRETALQSTDDQWGTVVAYYRRILEPNGVELDDGGYFSDPPETRRWNFRERHGVADALGECEPGDSIIVVSMSNAFRNHADFVDAQDMLAQRGIELHIALGNNSATLPDARMRAELLADVAQAEAERAREIAQERYAECRRQGKAVGRAPLGWKWGGPWGRRRLVADARDRAAMKDIRRLSKEGKSLDEIYWALRRAGIGRSNGQEWGRTTIWNALQRKL